MNYKSLIQLVAIAMIALISGCNRNDTPNGGQSKKPDVPEKKQEEKKPDVPEEPKPILNKYDLWIATGEGTSSNAKADPHAVLQIPTLLEGSYTVEGQGVETAKSGITPFVIYHKGYYYSLNRANYFGKYKIEGNQLKEIGKFRLPDLSDRRFAHEWLDDNTMVLIGAPSNKDSKSPEKQVINWKKIDAATLRVISSDTLKFTGVGQTAKDEKFSSCGLLAYRKSDNKLIYTFQHEELARKSSSTIPDKHKYFFTSIINATTMEVESVYKEDRAEIAGSPSFGSLRQQNGFFMDNDDYYMICNSVLPGAKSKTERKGHILRIKAGENKPDPSFKIDLFEDSKAITIHHIGGDKVIVYLENPMFTQNSSNWKTPRRFFWAVVDMKSGEQHNIKGIPYSQGGTFTELILVEKDYAILGISDDTQTKFYKYQYDNEQVTEAAKLVPGYFADRIISHDR